MKATSQPTNQSSGKIISDEAALERLFRANYPTLIEDAKGKLGDASASAPRVVSKAFHQAWNDRAQFTSNEELLAFLRAAIQHGAARELSRLAGLHRADHAVHGSNHPDGAHPHGQHETTEMSLDEAWTRLQHTLHGTVPEAQRARASTARHEAAEHMQALAKKRNWWPVVVGAGVALAAIIAVFMYVDRKGEGRRIDRALAAQDARNYDSRPGVPGMSVTLDDGTIVKLAPATRLTVPKLFGAKMRAVKVDGAAQFTVTQPGDRPFQAHAGDVVVFAKGTKFTIRRYAEDSAVTVDVSEGNVDVAFGQETRPVAQGAALRVSDKGTMEAPSPAQQLEAASWVNDTVTIQEHDLRYILPQLKRFYGLDIKVPDTKLLTRQVFLRAAINSPREAIASVEKSAGVKFTYVGESMTFQDTTLFKKKR